MVVVVGASGTITRTGICKNCGGEIRQWTPDGYCQVTGTDQPTWEHVDKDSGSGVYCQVTKAEPIEE